MANTEGPGGQPPAAWVWSHYQGETPSTPAPAPEGAARAARPAPAPEEFAARPASLEAAPTKGPAPAKSFSLIGLGVAAAVIVIAGLTWLFATKPASSPADPATQMAPAEPPAPEQKSEAAPAVPATPAAAEAPAPAPVAAPEAPKAEAPKAAAPVAEHGKKKKKH